MSENYVITEMIYYDAIDDIIDSRYDGKRYRLIKDISELEDILYDVIGDNDYTSEETVEIHYEDYHRVNEFEKITSSDVRRVTILEDVEAMSECEMRIPFEEREEYEEIRALRAALDREEDKISEEEYERRDDEIYFMHEKTLQKILIEETEIFTSYNCNGYYEYNGLLEKANEIMREANEEYDEEEAEDED